MTSAAQSAATSASNAISSAYNQAPDLGVTSTLQSAYDKLPAIRGDQTNAQQSSSQTNEEGEATQDPQQSQEISDNADPNATSGAQKLQTSHEERLNRSKDSGPSSESRIGKSQHEIGIEDNIPTAAGKGTTLPQDSTVQEAAGKAKRHDANVPQDFENVDCPSAEIRGEAPTNYGESGQGQQGGAAHTNGDAAEGNAEGQGDSHKRGLAQKIKDQVKGEVKVLKGVVKKDQETKAQGQAIKKGE